MCSTELAPARRGSSSAWAVAPGRGGAEAVHVDVDELGQLPGQEVDVDAGPAVDVGRVLPREHPDPHGGRAYNCGLGPPQVPPFAP